MGGGAASKETADQLEGSLEIQVREGGGLSQDSERRMETSQQLHEQFER